MRRALRDAVGILLAVAVVITPRSASAKFPAGQRESQPSQGHTVYYTQSMVLTEAHFRLEEIKVELALLADIATFPYDFTAHAAGSTLELRGFVPDDSVRQRALALARQSTFLTVADALKFRSNLSMRPVPRPAATLQLEGAELLFKNLGEPAKHFSLAVRSNGVVVVTGSIDSLESKREVSRLFRRLTGCFGVVNELAVRQVLRDGQRVVQVMRDGSMLLPPSVLGLEAEPVAAPVAASPPADQPAKPVAPASVAVAPALAAPRPSLVTAESSLQAPLPPAPSLSPPPADLLPKPATPPSAAVVPAPAAPVPVAVTPAPVSKAPPAPLPSPTPQAPKDPLASSSPAAPKPAPERIGCVPYTPSEPKLPIKWSSAATNWEKQVKNLEPVNVPPAPPAPPLPENSASRPAQTVWTRALPANVKPNGPSTNSRPTIAETRVPSPPPTMTWQSPGTGEESEPKAVSDPPRKEPSVSVPAPLSKEAPVHAPTPPRLASVSPVRSVSSSRRWPPAYEPSPPPGGRPGVIVFDDDPPPPSKPAHMDAATAPAIVPAKLQHQVKSACGGQAREVAVETQKDGIILVKVKVPNLAVEDKLTSKILAIPEMTAPKVRLVMDVSP